MVDELKQNEVTDDGIEHDRITKIFYGSSSFNESERETSGQRDQSPSKRKRSGGSMVLKRGQRAPRGDFSCPVSIGSRFCDDVLLNLVSSASFSLAGW